MPTPTQFCLLLVFSLCSSLGSSLCYAQFDSRPLSSLENRASNSPLPLPLEQAFPFYLSETVSEPDSETGPGLLRVTWTPAPGHYLYRHMFHFSVQWEGSDSGTEVAVTLPHGRRKTDQFFGDVEAYYDPVSADIRLPASLPPGAVLLIQYQGCADWGFCYPPQRREFPLKIVGVISDKF